MYLPVRFEKGKQRDFQIQLQNVKSLEAVSHSHLDNKMKAEQSENQQVSLYPSKS